MKRLKKLPNLREAVGVDADKIVLEFSKSRLEPLVADFIMPRSTVPLDFHIFAGSVIDFDPRLTNVDFVSAIEL